jgi:prevent-host-death family protein
MKVYTYSEARQKLAELLNQAQHEEVIIRRRDGATFSVLPKRHQRSPFDVKGIQTKASTRDILDAIKASRES